jgi:hypothetical protein
MGGQNAPEMLVQDSLALLLWLDLSDFDAERLKMLAL